MQRVTGTRLKAITMKMVLGMTDHSWIALVSVILQIAPLAKMKPLVCIEMIMFLMAAMRIY